MGSSVTAALLLEYAQLTTDTPTQLMEVLSLQSICVCKGTGWPLWQIVCCGKLFLQVQQN